MAVEVSLLGPLAVSVDGADATPTAPKERMLFALLALQAGSVVSDEQLIEDVWPELDAIRGRRVLQVRITALRKLLHNAGDVLLKRGTGYVLESPPVTLDVRRFEDAVRRAEERATHGDHEAAADGLRQALGFWRGDAFVDVDGCLTLEAEAARYRELRLGALESRVNADLMCGRHRSVIAELEGLVATHRYREDLWELTALALYRCGRQADALRVCATIRASLSTDLGLDPGPGLRKMEQAILEQRSELDGPVTSRGKARTPALLEQARTHPLVGRRAELATLTSAQSKRLAIVRGEAGIGKTRLVAELAATLAAGGASVLAGRCDEEPLSSFQPFREAFRATGAEQLEHALRSLAPADRAELGRLDPSLGGGRVLSGDGDRFQLYEAVADLLGALADSSPVVLVIEDLHWADRSTHRLLAHLVNHPACRGLFIVATTRPDGTSVSDELLRHPERVEQLQLQALTAWEVGALLQGDTPEDVARAVHQASGGNPLYAREILRHVGESGALSLTRVLAVPRELETIILKRAERLGPETARTLTAAAVLGQSFAVELLSVACEQAPAKVIDALEPAVTAGLLLESGGDTFTFGHAVVRNALDRSMLDARRARLHARAAAHLERTRPGHLAEAADHLREAGTLAAPQDLVRVLTGAAEQAFRGVAYDEAVELFVHALDAGGRAGLPQSELARLQLRCGIAREAAGDPDGKEAIRTAALAASDAGEPELFAHGALAFARMPLVVTGADPATVDLLEKTLAQLGDAEVPARARVASRLAYELFWEPGDKRERLAKESLDLARRIGDPATLAAVLADRRYDAGWTDLEQWLTESREILRLATVAADRELTWQGGYCCVNSLVLLGRFEEAKSELAMLTESAEELRRPRMQWWTTVAAASLRIAQGDFAEGERLSTEACQLGERTNDPDATPILLEQFYTLCLLQGRLDDVVDAVGAYAEQTPLSRIAHIAHGHALAHCGREAEATQKLASFAEHGFTDLPININWYANAALLGETAHLLGDARASRALIPLLTPQQALTIDVGASSTFMGPMSRYLGLVLATAGQLDAAVDALRDAVDRAHASRTPPWTALARNDLARILRLRGTVNDKGEAEELESVAHADAVRLGMGSLAARCRT